MTANIAAGGNRCRRPLLQVAGLTSAGYITAKLAKRPYIAGREISCLGGSMHLPTWAQRMHPLLILNDHFQVRSCGSRQETKQIRSQDIPFDQQQQHPSQSLFTGIEKPHFGKEGVPETLVPKISQETLAEMVGTTRSRVSFFMNRFRRLGFIDYEGGSGLQVHSSLLNVVLHD
jgi:Crp-like helix-turn-helix domain